MDKLTKEQIWKEILANPGYSRTVSRFEKESTENGRTQLEKGKKMFLPMKKDKEDKK